MSKTWTIEIDGVERNYKTLRIPRKLKRNSPTEFSAKIKYAADIDFFDLVEIKRDGTTEWKGFIEATSIDWDSQGRYLNVSGRDIHVILWKKFTDNYTNMHEDTGGFFGRVNANELIKLLLRTPKSDPVSDFPNNKSGWGIDVSRINELSAGRTSVGDPNWTKLRRRGYGWRNTGSPYNSAQKVVDGIECGDGVQPACNGASAWTPHGASPYLDAEDDANYISSGTADATAIFTCQDVTASSVEKIYLTVVWRPDQTWWSWISAECEIWVWIASKSQYVYVGVFGGRESPLKPNPWRHFTWDITSHIEDVADVNALKFKFVNKSSSLSMNITQAYLGLSYTTDGSQSAMLDTFDIPFEKENIVGIYVESRMDNESYPRNYDIVSLGDIEDFSSYVEMDPTGTHITIHGGSEPYIEFDSYHDETAYVVKDYGVDAIEDFDWKIAFKIDSLTNMPTLPPSHEFCPFVVSTHLEDYGTTYGTAGHYMVGADVYAVGGSPVIQFFRKDSLNNNSTTSVALNLGQRYFLRIIRSGTTVYYYLYDNDTLTNLIASTTYSIVAGTKFQYRYHANTWVGDEFHTEEFNDTLVPDSWTNVQEDWSHHVTCSDFDCINALDAKEIHSITVGHINEEYGFTNVGSECNGAVTVNTTVKLYANMKSSAADAYVRFYLRVNGVWQDVGTLRRGATLYGWGVDNGNDFLDVSGVLDTVAKINDVKMKIKYDSQSGPTVVYVRYVKLEVHRECIWNNAHADGEIYSITSEETTLISVTDNECRDIIHSWTPVEMDHLRIKITVDDPDHAWAISQIYLYKAEEIDYRVWKETGSPSFPDNQYIRDVSIDEEYEPCVGPLNVPQARLQDAINRIVGILRSSHVHYDWWLAYDANNTFHMDDRRGSDKSGSISFVKGTHLGGVNKESWVGEGVQRLKIIGRGEGKRQDNVSSDWREDTGEMANVNTFFEDVRTEKAVANRDEANLMADIALEKEAPPKTQLTVTVNQDEYDSSVALPYDVGDDVTITDSLTVTTGKHRIWNITKDVDSNGEVITLVLDEPYEDVNDAWGEIYRRLRELGIVGTLSQDWSGEATDENRVSSVEAVTDFFEKSAKNDEADQETTILDPEWYVSLPSTIANYTAAGGAQQTPEHYTYAEGMYWYRSDDWMKVMGTNTGAVDRTITIEIRGTTDNKIDVYMSQNPKLVCEIKAKQITEGEDLQYWRDGDFFDIGLASAEEENGYWFRLIRESGGILNLYVCWNEDGDWGDKDSDLQGKKLIRALEWNQKYRLEIITIREERIVIFNCYDVSLDYEQKYPPSIIKLNLDTTVKIRPLHMYLSSNHGDDPQDVQAIVFIYRFRTEWEKVQ